MILHILMVLVVLALIPVALMGLLVLIIFVGSLIGVPTALIHTKYKSFLRERKFKKKIEKETRN